MAEIRVEVCDVCLDRAREVTRWTIGVGSRSRTLALCYEHSQPLVDLMGLGAPERPSPGRKAPTVKKSTTKRSATRRTARSAPQGDSKVKLTEAQRRKLEEVQRMEG